MPLPIHIEITLANVAAIGGLVFGVAALVLSITNYLRDRATIVVDLRWDMTLRDATGAEEDVGVVTVSNVGRRPIYISHAALRMPKGAPRSHLLLMDSVKGDKLGEGDAPKIYTVKQSALTDYGKFWKQIRAQVSDSTGKVWLSKKNAIKKKPSWGSDGA